MDRRNFLLALAAGTLAGVTACDPRSTHPGALGRPDSASAALTGSTPHLPGGIGPGAIAPPGPTLGPAIPAVPSEPAPSPYAVTLGSPPSRISALPGTTNNVALTIDDGTDSAVVKAYLDFITAADLRLTFFVNGLRPSWTENAAQLRPLVESGQVQLGNHTWSHPDITTLAPSALASQLTQNDTFLNNTYGVTARPFFRPPYGFHNAQTDKFCAELGYSSIVMWYGSFGDSAVLTQQQLLTLASTWLLANHVVIGHANHPTVTTLYPQILELLRERNLKTVTLDDVFYAHGARPRGTANS